MVSAGNTGATVAAVLLTLGRIRGSTARRSRMLPTTAGKPRASLTSGRRRRADVRKPRPVRRDGVALHGARYRPRAAEGGPPTWARRRRRATAAPGDACRAQGQRPRFGNVEGRDVMRGTTDIAVCDGFTGNVLIKGFDRHQSTCSESIRNDIFLGPLGKIAYLFGWVGVRKMRHRLDDRTPRLRSSAWTACRWSPHGWRARARSAGPSSWPSGRPVAGSSAIAESAAVARP